VPRLLNFADRFAQTRSESVATKETLLAFGDRKEAEIAADRAVDARLR
jgi:hypothetical protein